MRSRQVRARHSSVPTNDHKLPRRPRTASQQSHQQRLQHSAPTLLPLYIYNHIRPCISTGTTQQRPYKRSQTSPSATNSKPAISRATPAAQRPYSSTSVYIQTTHDQDQYGHDTVAVAIAIVLLPADLEQQASNRANNACHHMPLLFYLYTYTTTHDLGKYGHGTPAAQTNNAKLPHLTLLSSSTLQAARCKQRTKLPLTSIPRAGNHRPLEPFVQQKLLYERRQGRETTGAKGTPNGQSTQTTSIASTGTTLRTSGLSYPWDLSVHLRPP